MSPFEKGCMYGELVSGNAKFMPFLPDKTEYQGESVHFIKKIVCTMERTMRNSLGPLILILLGVFLLLSNLDLLPIGKLKALVATWWPLALVIVGVIQLKKKR
jgi:hypothetical protein